MSETIREERDQQQTNAEVDAFLASVQMELSDLKHRLAQLRKNKKKKKARSIRKPKPFDVSKVKEEIEEIKQRIILQDETDSLLRTHPPASPADKLHALDILVRDVRKQVDAKRRRKADILSTIPDEDVAEIILEFYIVYAVFVEYFNSMKMLYQVLIAEYELNDLLEPRQVGFLRTGAIARIAVLLCRQGWLGPASSKNRSDFRTSMMKAIRRSVGQRASRQDDGQKTFPPMSALCLSGGGIRSATFGLGVIQALARHGLLDKFDYLSTVSGGGYIGSWLTAWAKREPNGISTVQNLLSRKAKEKVEPPEVTHLRSFSNYMSPRTGLLSADTWTLIGVYLRNLTLIWFVAVPLIAAFLLLPRLLLEFTYNGQALVGTGPTLRAGFVTVVSFVLGCMAMFGITVFRPSLSKFLKPNSWFQQRFKKDDVGSLKNMDLTVILLCVLPLIVFAMGITSYGYWLGQSPERQQWVDEVRKAAGANRYIVLGVLVVIFVGFGVANIFYRRDRRVEGGWDKFFGSVVIGISILVGALQLVFPQELMLFNLVVFTNLVFIVGFVFARAFILWQLRGTKSKSQGFFDNVPIEFSISFLAASIGGALLFAVNAWLHALQPSPQVYATVAVPLFLGVFMAAATFFIGVGSKILDDLDREWASRFGAWLLVCMVAWLAVCGIVLVGPLLLSWLNDAARDWLISAGGLAGIISGAVTLIFGYYAKNSPQDDKKPKGKASALVQFAPQIAAPLFAAFLLILIVLGTDRLIAFVGSQITFMDYSFHYPPPESWEPGAHGGLVITIWIFIFLAVGLLMGWWINVNKFSLHAAYRDRLIRAFLGASRGTERIETANSFIGLDERDNIEMHKLEQKPFHVVNMTLNVAGSSTLRWQSRKSESFTVTPLYCGSSNMGGGTGNYRSSKLFGADKMGKAITLGTAAAISGAAASPNMGYYTQSAAVSALMALFNVRLGWWLGNPGRRGADTFTRTHLSSLRSCFSTRRLAEPSIRTNISTCPTAGISKISACTKWFCGGVD